MPMLTITREMPQTEPLGAGLLSRGADFRTLAEAIAGPIFISQRNQLYYVNHAAEIVTGWAFSSGLERVALTAGRAGSLVSVDTVAACPGAMIWL